MPQLFRQSEPVYGKTLWVQYRLEGDGGMVGDGLGAFDPGDEWMGITYDMAFAQLSERGYIDVPVAA